MSYLLIIAQLFCSLTIAIYFIGQYRMQRTTKVHAHRGSDRELEKLKQERDKTLTQPLSEKTRPKALDDIVGQKDGIRALRAALGGENPQHVIIYGPPGIGKTCAARLLLEEAKKSPRSPFKQDAKFIEIDATCIRFDERSIADPLIGSVHDPIYQGAGALGAAGVPQPKPGAVTKANGGVLFLDEIGELHPVQMNKLLKVLEDRKVFFESAYYNQDDMNIPPHIHDIFKSGLPADFRLVGATTCRPEDIPPALRSRCLEVFFSSLDQQELAEIARNAAKMIDMELEESVSKIASSYCDNGRDLVNMMQLSAGVAQVEGRDEITCSDIEWVAETCRMQQRIDYKIELDKQQIGVINALAVDSEGKGLVMEIEATAERIEDGKGQLRITGIAEQEEISGKRNKIKRKSMAAASFENVLTALRNCTGLNYRDYNIHVNFPGGVPVDGPSAGIAMALALYSAMTGLAPMQGVALTGEISINGRVKPVGGVKEKIAAAEKAGAKCVLIPCENYKKTFDEFTTSVKPVGNIYELLEIAFNVSISKRGVKYKNNIAAALEQATV